MAVFATIHNSRIIIWLNVLNYLVYILFICRINSLDMATAVQYLREPDADLQVLGAAFIQHECYNDSDAKNEVPQRD